MISPEGRSVPTLLDAAATDDGHFGEVAAAFVELAAASVTQAPRLTRPAAQA